MSEGDENVQHEINTHVQLQRRDYCPLKINVRHKIHHNRTSRVKNESTKYINISSDDHPNIKSVGPLHTII